MRIWLAWISNLGASLSNSAVKVPSIGTAGPVAAVEDIDGCDDERDLLA
jgi:hypothetical protein